MIKEISEMYDPKDPMAIDYFVKKLNEFIIELEETESDPLVIENVIGIRDLAIFCHNLPIKLANSILNYLTVVVYDGTTAIMFDQKIREAMESILLRQLEKLNKLKKGD